VHKAFGIEAELWTLLDIRSH